MGLLDKNSSRNYICIATRSRINKARNKTISVQIIDDSDTE